MSTVKVFSDLKKLAEQIKNDESIIEFSKPSDPVKGINFYNIRIKDPEDGIKKDLIIRAKNIPISYGVFKMDESKGTTNKTVPLLFNVDEMGDYKYFIEAFEKVFIKWTQTAPCITELSKKNNVIDIIQRKYSDECRDETKRNKLKENPTTKLKLDFGTYSDKHRYAKLRGTKKTIVYDYTTKHVINKRVYFDEAKIDNMCIDEQNVDQFVTRGSMIMDARIHFPHVSRGQYGIACSPHAATINIKPLDDCNIYEGDHELVEEKEEPVATAPSKEEPEEEELTPYEGEVEYDE